MKKLDFTSDVTANFPFTENKRNDLLYHYIIDVKLNYTGRTDEKISNGIIINMIKQLTKYNKIKNW